MLPFKHTNDRFFRQKNYYLLEVFEFFVILLYKSHEDIIGIWLQYPIGEEGNKNMTIWNKTNLMPLHYQDSILFLEAGYTLQDKMNP